MSCLDTTPPNKAAFQHLAQFYFEMHEALSWDKHQSKPESKKVWMSKPACMQSGELLNKREHSQLLFMFL